MLPDEPRLRVLMVLESGFPVRGGGGAESQVRTLALRLRQRGHQVTVLTPLVPHAPQRRVERFEGIPVCRIAYPRLRGIGSIMLWIRLAAFLLRHGRRYDAWHVHIAHYLGAVCCAVGSRIGTPVVVKVSGWWELEKGMLAAGAGRIAELGRAALRRASALQAISHRIEGELERHGFAAGRIVYLPNAVDTGRFVGAATSTRSGPLSVIFVGRLVEEKNIDVLLTAWSKAFPRAGAARLRLVGNGEREAALRAQAVALGIADQVDFVGHRNDIETLLGEADLGVLPSKIEGLSNTLLEFMAAGLPVIASAVSGSEDMLIEQHNGWLFNVGDDERLAVCLREAAASGRERLALLGRQARADVAAAAGVDVVVDRLLSLYRSGPPVATTPQPVAIPKRAA